MSVAERPPVEPLDVWRCPGCGRILAKLRLGPGSVVKIRCTCNNYAEKER